MTFSDLKDFLINRMMMSHIYQPVMLMTLLKNGGVASVESLAKDLLINDQSQMEYYDKVTKNMVGKVLTKNNVVKKEGNSFNLLDFDSYSEKERNELINIFSQYTCLYKILRSPLPSLHQILSLPHPLISFQNHSES